MIPPGIPNSGYNAKVQCIGIFALAGLISLAAGALHLIKGRRSKALWLMLIGVACLGLSWYVLHSWDSAMRRVWQMHHDGATSEPSTRP
jgi:hypothetical protein